MKHTRAANGNMRMLYVENCVFNTPITFVPRPSTYARRRGKAVSSSTSCLKRAGRLPLPVQQAFIISCLVDLPMLAAADYQFGTFDAQVRCVNMDRTSYFCYLIASTVVIRQCFNVLFHGERKECNIIAFQ